MKLNTKILTLGVVVVSLGLLTVVVMEAKNQARLETLQADQAGVETEKTADNNSLEESEASQVMGVSDSQTLTETEPDILYWGSSCIECTELNNWLEAELADLDVNLVRKEVYENKENSEELLVKAQTCGLGQYGADVPFLFTGEQACITGASEIIGYFEQQYLQKDVVETSQEFEIYADAVEASVSSSASDSAVQD